MPAYAIAHIRETRFGDAIVEYLKRIDDTLRPFEGVYRVHGGPYEPLEGDWQGDIVILEFPSMTQARAWYASPAYQAIRALRTANTEGELILVEGVAPGHKGVDLLG